MGVKITMVKSKAQVLTQYVNHLNAIFKGEQFQILTPQGRQSVADQIDYALSPENLTCDGELSGTEVDRRYVELITAAEQLKRLDPSVMFYEI